MIFQEILDQQLETQAKRPFYSHLTAWDMELKIGSAKALFLEFEVGFKPITVGSRFDGPDLLIHCIHISGDFKKVGDKFQNTKSVCIWKEDCSEENIREFINKGNFAHAKDLLIGKEIFDTLDNDETFANKALEEAGF